MHPLAGQGLNQGILDVQCLSDVLQRGAANGQDIGSIHLLREYASVRYLRNLVMISACDKLHRLYTTDFAPVTWIRSLGLSAVNQLDVVKVRQIALVGNHVGSLFLSPVGGNHEVRDGH